MSIATAAPALHVDISALITAECGLAEVGLKHLLLRAVKGVAVGRLLTVVLLVAVIEGRLAVVTTGRLLIVGGSLLNGGGRAQTGV